MKELNQMRQKVFVSTTIAGACLFIGFVLFISSPVIGGFLFVGGIIGLITISTTIGAKFKKYYKEAICKTIIERMFDVDMYDPEKGFDEEFVKSTYLIPSGNRFASDDYLRGRYKGYRFERSDVRVEDVHSTGKTTTTVTLFQGSWTIFKFPKKISSYLMIREKEFLSGGRPGGIFSNAPYTEKVKFEDIAFNERFEVYAEDEHDAFYVLTPQFIEKIKELEFMEDGRMIIGIINQEIHILFDNRINALEPSILKEVTKEDFEAVEHEMYKIVRIMDILDMIPEI